MFILFCGFVLVLFLRDDCGPIETIKNVRSFQNSKYLQFPAGACEGMEDARVDDREPQATTDRNKGTRTTAMTIQVDVGSLRPAHIPWGGKSRVSRNGVEIATRVS